MKSIRYSRNQFVGITALFGLLLFMLFAAAGTRNSSAAPEQDYELYGAGDAIAEFEPENSKEPSVIYIKFDGVDGEVSDISHKGWCEVVSFEQAHTMQQTGTGPSRGKTVTLFDDVRIAKTIDKASPKLAEAVCMGHVYPTVQIHVTTTAFGFGRMTYLAFELKNVLITSYIISGAGQSEEVPTEQVTLSFEQIKMTYTEFDTSGKAKGNVEYTWKVEGAEEIR